MFRSLTITLFILSTLLALSADKVFAQSEDGLSELPRQEMRAVWVATVANLDWPNTTSPRYQKERLARMFDQLKENGINAIFFQVRTEADALYDSNYEPWSIYLTGEEGKAPDPYYDPLEFAIEEAHKRGMELHAWLNPYRAIRVVDNAAKASYSSDKNWSSIEQHINQAVNDNNNDFEIQYERADNHISKTHPEWLLYVGSIAIMNPGIPDVMQYITDVTMDVVNRYDVDGVHFDDYFYPYAPNTISDEDVSTYNEYGDEFDNIGDWRRYNVNTMIEMVHDSMKAVKPHVKFGISPFGKHDDGYSTLYADAYAWLDGEYIDYINPQLYWEITKSRYPDPTDFEALYDEWSEAAATRHTYAGHALYRAASGIFDSDEIPNQIEYVRANGDVNNTGSVFFRANSLVESSSYNIKDHLQQNYYRNPALTPTMSWLSETVPPTPLSFEVERDAEVDNRVHLSWEAPEFVNGNDTTLKYVIYRAVSDNGAPQADTVMAHPKYIAGITGQTSFTDNAPGGDGETYYFITAATTNSVESPATQTQSAGVIVSNENELDSSVPTSVALMQNYPNPFNPTTNITFELNSAQEVQLNVYNMLGQHVKTLIDADQMRAGTHSVEFNAAALPSGLYFYRLTAGGAELTKKMTLIK